MGRTKSRKIANTVTNYFQHVSHKNYSEALRELNQIEIDMTASEWQKGYINALQGMLIALRSDTRYAYIKRIGEKDQQSITKLRRAFSHQAEDPLQTDFDRGFFSAWSDYLRALNQTPVE
jgi:hypothetical protein